MSETVDSWRPCGGCPGPWHPGPQRMDCRAPDSASFQRRYCCARQQDRANCMGGYDKWTKLSRGGLKAVAPSSRLCEGDQTYDGEPVGPGLAKPDASRTRDRLSMKMHVRLAVDPDQCQSQPSLQMT